MKCYVVVRRSVAGDVVDAGGAGYKKVLLVFPFPQAVPEMVQGALLWMTALSTCALRSQSFQAFKCLGCGVGKILDRAGP